MHKIYFIIYLYHSGPGSLAQGQEDRPNVSDAALEIMGKYITDQSTRNS